MSPRYLTERLRTAYTTLCLGTTTLTRLGKRCDAKHFDWWWIIFDLLASRHEFVLSHTFSPLYYALFGDRRTCLFDKTLVWDLACYTHGNVVHVGHCGKGNAMCMTKISK